MAIRKWPLWCPQAPFGHHFPTIRPLKVNRFPHKVNRHHVISNGLHLLPYFFPLPIFSELERISDHLWKVPLVYRILVALSLIDAPLLCSLGHLGYLLVSLGKVIGLA